jgi:hypothetical protein
MVPIRYERYHRRTPAAEFAAVSRLKFPPLPLQAAQAKLRAAEDRRAAANDANNTTAFVDASIDCETARAEINRLRGEPILPPGPSREARLEMFAAEAKFRPLANAVTFASIVDRPDRIAVLLEAYSHLRFADIDFDSHFPLLPLSAYPTGPALVTNLEGISAEEEAFNDAWNVWQTAHWYGTPDEAATSRLALESTRAARDKALKLRTVKS